MMHIFTNVGERKIKLLINTQAYYNYVVHENFSIAPPTEWMEHLTSKAMPE